MDNKTEIASIAVSAVGGIVMLYASVFADVHRSIALWINYFGACLILFGPFLYVQDCYWEEEAPKSSPATAVPDAAQTISQTTGLITPGNAAIPELKPVPPMSDEEMKALGLDSLPDELKKDFLTPREHVGKGQFEEAKKNPANVFVILGNSFIWTSANPVKVFRQADEEMVTLERDGNAVGLTAKFFDASGKPICHIVKNRFRINEGNYRMESHPHRLVVYSPEAKEVLNIEFVNERTFKLLGDFYLRNRARIVLGSERQYIGNTVHSASVIGDCGGGFMVN